MNDYLNERLKSRNIHSEIVFCLSPNNNVRVITWQIVFRGGGRRRLPRD